jgi:hypothetical protein
MNPVIEGYISYSDLKNGTLNLYDLYLLNKVLERKSEVIKEEERKIQRQIAIKKAK